MNYFRSHPINILEKTSKYLVLLLIPILRAVFSSQDGFSNWLVGAWFDILVILFIVGLGTYQWYRFVFAFDQNGIYMTKGIIIQKKRFVSFEKLSSISIEKPFYFRPIKAVRMSVDTDGGQATKVDFQVTVSEDTGTLLTKLAKLPFMESNTIKKMYVPNSFSIAVFSFINSNTLTGVIYFAIAISKMGDIFGREFSDEIINRFSQFTELMNFGLPPFAAYIAYGLLFCWGISFVINLAKHLKFTIFRKGDIINISSGLITKRKYALIVPRISFLSIRQSLLTRIIGFYSASIHCTGYGKSKNEKSVIFPSGEREDMRTNLKVLLPNIDIVSRQIRPQKKVLTRFIFYPILVICIIVAVGLVGFLWVDYFHSTIVMLCVISLVPAFWWLFVKIFSFKFTGIGVGDNVYTIYYTSGYKIITCSIPKDKTVKIVIYQSLLQKRKNCCNVIFYSYAESKKKQKVINMPIDEAYKLLSIGNDDIC